MKHLFLALSMLVSASSFASEITSVPEGTYGLNQIAGDLVDVQPLCPEDHTCFVDGTVVTISFTLGCMSTLAPLNAKAVEANGKLQVIVSATELRNEQERVVFCFAPQVVRHSFTFIDQYGDVEVSYLGVSQQN